MKMNKTGLYDVGDGEDMFIEDVETGQKMVFVLDFNERVVIRSFLEEDIKPVVSLLHVSASEKRKRMRMLWEAIPQEGSHEIFFVAERIIGEENDVNIYEEDRELIGLCIRSSKSLDMMMLKDYTDSQVFIKMLSRIADYYGIKGQPYYIPAS